jgi:hypothetical protein
VARKLVSDSDRVSGEFLASSEEAPTALAHRVDGRPKPPKRQAVHRSPDGQTADSRIAGDAAKPPPRGAGPVRRSRRGHAADGGRVAQPGRALPW